MPAERLDELRALPLSDVLFVDLDRGALYVGGGADDDGLGLLPVLHGGSSGVSVGA